MQIGMTLPVMEPGQGRGTWERWARAIDEDSLRIDAAGFELLAERLGFDVVADNAEGEDPGRTAVGGRILGDADRILLPHGGQAVGQEEHDRQHVGARRRAQRLGQGSV